MVELYEPDMLVFMGVIMPGMSGREAAVLIRVDHPSAIIYSISGDVQPADRQFSGQLVKPFVIQNFRDTYARHQQAGNL